MVAAAASPTRTTPRTEHKPVIAAPKKTIAPTDTTGARTGTTGTTAAGTSASGTATTGTTAARAPSGLRAADGTAIATASPARPDDKTRANVRTLMAHDQSAALHRLAAVRNLDRGGTAPTLEQVEAGTHVLMRGHEGPAVKEVQGDLNGTGVEPQLTEDGKYGTQTEAAVRDFQQKNGLPVDGKLGKDTLAALESPTSEQIQNDPRFQLLDCQTQADVRARLDAAKDDPAARQNIADLARSDGMAQLSMEDRKKALEIQGQDVTDRALTDDLVGLTGDKAFQALPDATQSTVLAEYGRHTADPAARKSIQDLATSPGFAGLPEGDQQKLARYVGGTNTQLSGPARGEMDKLLASDAYKNATPAEQTAQLQKFLTDQPGLVGVTNGLGTNFDSVRQPYEITGPTDVAGFDFPSGKADALRYEVEIDGRKIAVYLPKTPDPSSGAIHSVEDMARGLAALPEANRALVNEVRVDPKRNPQDEYWAKQYNSPDFRSYMTAGADGKITVYPSSGDTTADQSVVDSSFIHETGHTLSGQQFGGDDDKRWDDWESAMASDGLSASGYAKNSKGEDFAESLVLYQTVRGTPQEAEIRALMPERFAILDRMIGGG